MTAAELHEIFLSAEFKTGLEQLSSYLASIMQEGPIVHLLAKCLWNQSHLYALERNKRHDLTVWAPSSTARKIETSIEFKFNYDTCAERLRIELNRLVKALEGGTPERPTKESGYDVMPRIFKDVCAKKPDIFIWIICSRDLSGINADQLERIVNWKPLKKLRRTHPFKADREFLTPINALLHFLQRIRPFSIVESEIETNGYFPSVYHFRICEFLKAT
jgi:hypothetical protein